MSLMAHLISDEIISAIKDGNHIFIIGNGGSSQMANHFAGEMVAKFEKDRRALPFHSLCTDVATITAIANDMDYSKIFRRQLEAFAKKGDVLITLSTSGTSKNIVEAIWWARNIKEMKVFEFPTKGNTYEQNFLKTTAECQEAHLKLLHQISREVENAFS